MAVATYHWLRVRSATRGWSAEYERFRDGLPAEIAIWGAFAGLFGIGSNELVVVLHSEGAPPLALLAESGFDVVESFEFEPTVRPTQFTPLDRAGVFVFRFFEVANADTDEIARLSNAAWATFEHSDAYTTEPLALFREVDRSNPVGVMLLVTWYDGLTSWEASRSPAPEARDLFRRRRELTRGAIASATRLVPR